MGAVIKSTIKQFAQSRGINNANQLGLLIGVTPNVSARLWKDDFSQIGKVTLDKLCSALKCQVGDLLVYKSDKKTRQPIRSVVLTGSFKYRASKSQDITVTTYAFADAFDTILEVFFVIDAGAKA